MQVSVWAQRQLVAQERDALDRLQPWVLSVLLHVMHGNARGFAGCVKRARARAYRA